MLVRKSCPFFCWKRGGALYGNRCTSTLKMYIVAWNNEPSQMVCLGIVQSQFNLMLYYGSRSKRLLNGTDNYLGGEKKVHQWVQKSVIYDLSMHIYFFNLCFPSSIRPLPDAWAHRFLWLAQVAVSDRREYKKNMGNCFVNKCCHFFLLLFVFIVFVWFFLLLLFLCHFVS